ncbi:MAG: hypothetical protein IJX98_01035 [Clostridia bacterium]|nr:hypothetical protein [Clostridia bacterium]
MKKLLSILLAILGLFVFVACGEQEQTNGRNVTVTVEKQENVVAITVTELSGDYKLDEVMTVLQEKGELTFTVADGAITSIDGVENAANWNPCWMCYTSDGELSNADWGTYEWKGETLGSATLGATALPVIEGGVYLWVYAGY